MIEHNVQLVKFQDEDEVIFEQWLNKDYIYKWFCCDGKEGEQAQIDGLEEKQSWLDEVTSREDNPHRHLYIVTCNGRKIGFGICIDLSGEPEYAEAQYPDLSGKIKAGEALELGYCIGEEDYLRKGIGKAIVKRLEEECRNLGAALLLSDPNEENTPSVKVLLFNGFEKFKNGDYRKRMI